MMESINTALGWHAFVEPRAASFTRTGIAGLAPRLPNATVGPSGQSAFIRNVPDLSETGADGPRVNRIPIEGKHFNASGSTVAMAELGVKLDVLA